MDKRGIHHTFYHIDDVIKMGQDYTSEHGYTGKKRQMYVIVPDYDENPKDVNSTIKMIGYANQKAKSLEIDFRVNGIILSDQSETKKTRQNRGALYTAKDFLKRECESSIPIPEIYQLVLGKETDEIIGDYASKFLGDYLKSEKEPRGKGWNMFISSLATGRYPDDEVAIMYIDAENEQIGPSQIIAMGYPIYNMTSDARLVKAAFDRYHMELDMRNLGGRVNASSMKPFLNMLSERGMMQRIRYPLSGEMTIRRDVLWDIDVARQFGVEWATMLQLISPLSDKMLDMEKEFAEVYLGINMDQPLAEGKSKKWVLDGIGKMTDQIMNANNAIIGDDIKNRWKSPESLMNSFKREQSKHCRKWSRKFRNWGQPVDITGRITLDEVKSRGCERVDDNIRRLYSGDEFEGDLMAPMSRIREDIGDSQFDEFLGSMMDMRKNIT